MLTLPLCLVQSGPSFSASNASSAPAVNSATPTGKLLDKICNQKLAHILISDVKTKVNAATIRSVSKSRSISLHLCSSHLSFERISSDAKMMIMFQNLLGCFTNTIWSSSKHLHAFLMKIAKVVNRQRFSRLLIALTKFCLRSAGVDDHFHSDLSLSI